MDSPKLDHENGLFGDTQLKRFRTFTSLRYILLVLEFTSIIEYISSSIEIRNRETIETRRILDVIKPWHASR